VFTKGISDKFVAALLDWKHWKEIITDRDLFLAIRNESVNIYFQGCSIFKISFQEKRLNIETHYKYLLNPDVKKPYISWNGEGPAISDDRLRKIFVSKFDVGSLKKSSSRYAGDEKRGVHSILKSNKNIIDVEVALSSSGIADRIDFAALQRKGKDDEARIVFFEAKRFDNPELSSRPSNEPRVIKQIGKYETFITDYKEEIADSYRRICQNLTKLVPDRCDPLVFQVADIGNPLELAVDSDVRLVVFGYDADQDEGTVWRPHKDKLRTRFKSYFLLKGSPDEFSSGISK
jgi:hypothetical protein